MLLFSGKVIGIIIIIIMAGFLILLSLSGFFNSFTNRFEQESSASNSISPDIISLPQPKTVGLVSVEEALAKRRSIREYSSKAISIENLSQILWSTQGITEPRWGLRTAPSAGATYPLEVYAVIGINGVSGLDAGVYRYESESHTLRLIVTGDLRDDLSRAALDQAWVKRAPISIIISAVYERTTNHYGERGIRYVHMEVGHAGENLYLEATALDLGCVAVGAFIDEEVHKILHLPEDEEPLYIIPVGHKK